MQIVHNLKHWFIFSSSNFWRYIRIEIFPTNWFKFSVAFKVTIISRKYQSKTNTKNQLKYSSILHFLLSFYCRFLNVVHNICVMFLFNIVHVHFPSRKLQVIIFYNKNVKSLQTSPYINFVEAFSITNKYYFDIYFLFGYCAITNNCWRF